MLRNNPQQEEVPDSMLFPATYNTMDEYESNGNILRAEAMAMATPLSAEYADQFYSSLKNIEMTCSADMDNLCPDNTMMMMDWAIDPALATSGSDMMIDPSVFYIFSSPYSIDGAEPVAMNRRHLTEEVSAAFDANNGLKMITSVRDAFLNRFNRKQQPQQQQQLQKPSFKNVGIVPPDVAAVASAATASKEGHKTVEGEVTTTFAPPPPGGFGPPPGPFGPPPPPPSHYGHPHGGPYGGHPQSLRGEEAKSRPAKMMMMKSQDAARKLVTMMRHDDPHHGPHGDDPHRHDDPHHGPHDDFRGGDSDSDSDGESDNESDGEDENDSANHHHHHGHHKYHSIHGNMDEHGQMHGPPDDSYSGALGFGAARDLCLYQNFEQLSTPCQTAITDHYELRQDYWMKESGHGCDPLSILLWSSFFLLGFVALRRFFGRRHHERHMKVMKIMDTIRANPSLKATIEAEAGVQVPPKQRCGAHKFLRGFLMIVLTLASALMIAISSLLFTVTILTAMMPPSEDGSESQPPSVFFSIFVLISVCAAEVGAFFMILRGCKRTNQVNAASAGENNNNSDGNNAAQPSRFSRYLTWAPTFSGIRSFRLSPQPITSDGYVALMNDDTQHGQSEMVTFSQHGPNTAYIVQPSVPYSPYVGVSVPVVTESMTSAQPVSHIHMI